MRTKEGNQILEIIRQHHGQAEAISAVVIATKMGRFATYERTVRQIIKDESCLWDRLICSSGKGYFVAENYDEALTTWNWLKELRDQAEIKLAAFETLMRSHGLAVPKLEKEAA